MGYAKDQMIECMEEERDNLVQALDQIEAYGEGFEWYVWEIITVHLQPLTNSLCSSNKHCDNRVCSKLCFARRCFDWCLTHSHPSVEDLDGEASVEV